MKNIIKLIVCCACLFSLSGCGLMEDAFKAGVFFALLIVAIIGLLIWILRFGIRQLKKHYTIEF